MIIKCIINNNAIINNNLWKNPRSYFALKNSHVQTKEFLRGLLTIWARAAKRIGQPCPTGTYEMKVLLHTKPKTVNCPFPVHTA